MGLDSEGWLDKKMGVGSGMGWPLALLTVAVVVHSLMIIGPLVYPPFWHNIFAFLTLIGLQ